MSKINIMGIKKKLLLTIIPVFLFGLIASAQIKTLTGTVKGMENNPLSGVTVQVKGTNITTLTDADGSFSIQTSGRAKTLVFSYVGMKTQEVSISGNTDFQIHFEQASGSLNEVVVVGYGTQKKIDLTGSVSTVDANELTKRPSSNVQNLLHGKIPGLEVSSAGGKPGNEGNTLRIRGLGTFSSAGSNPLVLIDGVQGDMTNLDPDDVESISVLKDAASGSIYGAQAANGVILITTKKGKAGVPTISYNSSVQLQSATRLPDLLYNSADYMQYWNEGRIRSGQTQV